MPCHSLRVFEHLACSDNKILTSGRKSGPRRRALEQRDTKLIFYLFNALADDRLPHIKFISGRAEATVASGSDNIAKMAQVHSDYLPEDAPCMISHASLASDLRSLQISETAQTNLGAAQHIR